MLLPFFGTKPPQTARSVHTTKSAERKTTKSSNESGDKQNQIPTVKNNRGSLSNRVKQSKDSTRQRKTQTVKMTKAVKTKLTIVYNSATDLQFRDDNRI